MKPKNLEFKSGVFKYLLFLPFLLFTFCDSDFDELNLSYDVVITKDSKVISLMEEAVKSKSDLVITKSGNDDNDQCTEFQYPITFYLMEEIPQPIIIYSDEELLAFFNSLTDLVNISLYFPITLIDVDGVKTTLYNLTELEGTLQMALDACDGNGDDDDGLDDGNDDIPYDFCHKNNKKVYICHKGQTICVSINAIWGHTNQHAEDYLGQCE